MPRELTDILEEIDQRVRDGLPAVDGKELHIANDAYSDSQFWRYVGIAADVIRLLLEYRCEHAPAGNWEAELRRGQQRIDALWPRCCHCQQPMSWRNSSSQLLGRDVDELQLCKACRKAGFRLSDFGECPVCHGDDGCRSIDRDHWYFCDTHRTKWCIGSNLFSVELTEEESLQNAAHLSDYREVEPSFWASLKHAYRVGALWPRPLSREEDLPF